MDCNMKIPPDVRVSTTTWRRKPSLPAKLQPHRVQCRFEDGECFRPHAMNRRKFVTRVRRQVCDGPHAVMVQCT